jgi:hypothetical protein
MPPRTNRRQTRLREERRRRGALRLLRDVAAYSSHALERPLRPYQLEAARAIAASVLNAEGLTFTVMFPRQAGKNELSAHLEAFLLHRHQSTGGSLVKCAPTFRPQLVNSLLRLEGLLQGRLTAGRWRKRYGYLVEVGRASLLLFSAEPRASVLGATASLLLEGDEAQDLDPTRWDRDFRPMAATTQATSVLYGTPWTDDTLLAREVRLNRELEARDGRRRHFEVDWQTVAAANPAYARHVQAEIDRLGQSHPIVQTQYLLEPLGRAGRFLDATQLALLRGEHPPQACPELVERVDPTAPLCGVRAPAEQRTARWGPGVYVAGLDVAGADEEDPQGLLVAANPRRDSTALTIAYAERARVADLVVEPRFHVVRQYLWRGTPHRQLYPHVLSLVRDLWKCRAVVVDATGVGGGLAAFLSAALGPRTVRSFLYTAASKSKLAYDFLAAVNAGRFKLHVPTPETPEVHEFFRQAEAAQYSLRANQTMSFYVPPSKGHDDLLNAAALLVQAGPLTAHRLASGRPGPRSS